MRYNLITYALSLLTTENVLGTYQFFVSPTLKGAKIIIFVINLSICRPFRAGAKTYSYLNEILGYFTDIEIT